MNDPPRALKIGSIIWSIVIAVAAIALLGSVLLPSTKRAHFNYQKLHGGQLEDAATTQPQAPATRP